VSATQTVANPDFTAGDATLAPSSITHTLFTQPFGISQADYDDGARLEWLVQLNAQTIAAAISDQLSSVLTVANFGSAIVKKTAANFGVTDFEAMYSAVPTRDRAIVLDTSYFARVKPLSWCPPGFSNVLEHTRWSAADTNVHGFVGDPRAIIVSYSAPTLFQPNKRKVMAEITFMIPQIGLQGTLSTYYLLSSRQLMGAISLYMGATVGDSNALKLLTSA
jgi:hypothetical protein